MLHTPNFKSGRRTAEIHLPKFLYPLKQTGKFSAAPGQNLLSLCLTQRNCFHADCYHRRGFGIKIMGKHFDLLHAERGAEQPYAVICTGGLPACAYSEKKLSRKGTSIFATVFRQREPILSSALRGSLAVFAQISSSSSLQISSIEFLFAASKASRIPKRSV